MGQVWPNIADGTTTTQQIGVFPKQNRGTNNVPITTSVVKPALSQCVLIFSGAIFFYHWIRRFSNTMSRSSFLGSLVDVSSVAPIAAYLHFLTQCSNLSRLCGPTRAANQPTQNRRKLTKIMLCVAQQIAHHQSRWKGRQGKIIRPQSNAEEQMQFM